MLFLSNQFQPVSISHCQYHPRSSLGYRIFYNPRPTITLCDATPRSDDIMIDYTITKRIHNYRQDYRKYKFIEVRIINIRFRFTNTITIYYTHTIHLTRSQSALQIINKLKTSRLSNTLAVSFAIMKRMW